MTLWLRIFLGFTPRSFSKLHVGTSRLVLGSTIISRFKARFDFLSSLLSAHWPHYCTSCDGGGSAFPATTDEFSFFLEACLLRFNALRRLVLSDGSETSERLKENIFANQDLFLRYPMAQHRMALDFSLRTAYHMKYRNFDCGISRTFHT